MTACINCTRRATQSPTLFPPASRHGCRPWFGLPAPKLLSIIAVIAIIVVSLLSGCASIHIKRTGANEQEQSRGQPTTTAAQTRPGHESKPKPRLVFERNLDLVPITADTTSHPKQQQGHTQPLDKRSVETMVGKASYYGYDFAGQLTASGEIFDPSELTAAHRTLPFGTRVRVTNLQNGKQVIVRINDRGPFVESRIIDVSRRAAELLGMIGAGVTRVRLQVLD